MRIDDQYKISFTPTPEQLLENHEWLTEEAKEYHQDSIRPTGKQC